MQARALADAAYVAYRAAGPSDRATTVSRWAAAQDRVSALIEAGHRDLLRVEFAVSLA
jgi:hypothetical protein